MPNPESSGRSTFLIVLMLTLVGAGAFLFTVVVLGPQALALGVVIGGIGLCHYLLWGRSLNREVESERAEALAEDAAEEVPPETNGWPSEGPHGPRRF
jgi:hypothetical protein